MQFGLVEETFRKIYSELKTQLQLEAERINN